MFKIEPNSGEPIYKQIIYQVRQYIVKGYFQPGDKIPSVRELAKELQVNQSTVAKAIQEMEALGMVETQIGSGTYIKEVGDVDQASREAFEEKFHELLVEAKYLGYTRSELVELIDHFERRQIDESTKN